jgi:hypothetical protein
MSGLFRHTLATLAYRAGKALRGAPPEFAAYQADESSRTPAEILAHMGDLFDWAFSIAEGKPAWRDSRPLSWDAEVARFFAALARFDERVRSAGLSGELEAKLFQGPVADALTHTGQLAMLRRMAGCACRGENYYAAEIVTGRVGLEQAAPRREF